MAGSSKLGVAGTLQIFVWLVISGVVHAQSPLTCVATADRHAFQIPASGESGLSSNDGIELTGDNEYSAALPNGWQFMLVKTEHGWAVRVYDQPYPNGRVDLSGITPPLHGPANPRDIAGWHFRNHANTGPNLGDVNAPQRLRLFQFDGALAGTSGLYNPVATTTTEADTGRGALYIVGYELTGQRAEGRARMTYLKFQACLTWPRLSETEETARTTEHERRARQLDAQVLDYLPVERELFARCGLDTTRYELTARVTPRLLGLDIDGDGAHDEAVQISRLQDGEHGLALCRGGTWLDVLGFDEKFYGPTRLLLSAMESWRVAPPDHGRFGFMDEAPWPDTAGDALLVERFEKGMAAFFWRDGSLQVHKVYGMVPM